MDTNYIFCFAVAKTVFDEAKGKGFLLQELMGNSSINFLKNVKKESLNNCKDFKIYENYLFYKNLIAPENLQKFHLGLSKEDHEKYIKFYLKNSEFKSCFNLAKKIVNGFLKDKSFGSTHYHKNDKFPAWATGHGGIIQEENYIFYNDIII